jgi:cystathionine beta-lyase family protein involved in aluminum resistance
MIKAAERALDDSFQQIDAVALINQKRVLEAMSKHRLTEEHFAEHTGYGLNDVGREVMDKVFAHVMQAESAAVRLQLVSGTHAIACTLLGNLAPGDRMVCLTGRPYDTLHPVIGRNKVVPGSLRAQGVEYVEADIEPGNLNQDSVKTELKNLLSKPTKIVYLQKSCGYSATRRTLSNEEIGKLCRAAKEFAPHAYAIVDNCYGEFVEEKEPTACGADLVVGSLIKNPGGGLAICGGYFAGKKELVEGALTRLTAPGNKGHLGVMYNQGRLIMQGLYMAPCAVANAVKGSLLIAHVFADLGMKVKPTASERRFDIVQTVELGTAERLLKFCQLVQSVSPVNAHVVPVPSPLPGYDDEVVMAGGTFIEGATIELSADGPMRPPFMAYIQAGLSYLHVKYLVETVLNSSELGN